jgi:hypothetical protein
MSGTEWYNNPHRNCFGDYRFVELFAGTRGKQVAEELIELCNECPVLTECAADLANRKYEPQGIVQAGQWFPATGKLKAKPKPPTPNLDVTDASVPAKKRKR